MYAAFAEEAPPLKRVRLLPLKEALEGIQTSADASVTAKLTEATERAKVKAAFNAQIRVSMASYGTGGKRGKMLAQAQQNAGTTSGVGGSSGSGLARSRGGGCADCSWSVDDGFSHGSGRGVGGFPERSGGGGGSISDRGGGGFVTKDADVEARPLEPPRPPVLAAPLQCFSASSDSSIAKDMLTESSRHYAKMYNTTICTLCNVPMHGWAPDWEMHFRSSAHKNKVRQQKKEALAAGWQEEELLRQEEESVAIEEESLRQEEEPGSQPQHMAEEESLTASRQERMEARARVIEAGRGTYPQTGCWWKT